MEITLTLRPDLLYIATYWEGDQETAVGRGRSCAEALGNLGEQMDELAEA